MRTIPTEPGRGTALLDRVVTALLRDPSATMEDLARAGGVSRTTLHRRFPTRTTLLREATRSAYEALIEAHSGHELDTWFDALDTDASWEALRRWVADLIPLAPQLNFLGDQRRLAAEAAGVSTAEEMDEPLRAAVRRGQQAGVLSAEPTDWLVETLYGLVYIAWDRIHAGALARLDAPDQVVRTWRYGVGAEHGKGTSG